PNDLFMLSIFTGWEREIPLEAELTGHLGGLTGLKALYLHGAADTRFIENLESLVYLSIGSNELEDNGLACLTGLKSLEILSLNGEKLTDAGLVHAAGLTSLEEMHIIKAPGISGPGLVHLANLPSLRCLELRGVSDDVGAPGESGDVLLEHLTGMTQLKKLELMYRHVTDAGMAYLSTLTGLEDLGLSETKISDEGLAHLQDMKHLRRLDLSRQTQIGDAGMAYLKGLKSLERLELPYETITDAGLAEISELTNLKRLSVGTNPKSQITDSGLESLSNLTSLEELAIGGVGISDAGLREIGKLTNLRVLRLLNAPLVTDDGLDALASLTSLRSLTLRCGSKITVAGLNHLNTLTGLTNLTANAGRRRDVTMDIGDLTQLRSLDLPVFLRDEDLACLSQFPNLERLTVSGRFGNEGMAHLAGLTSISSLRISSSLPDLNDDGLSYLAGMKLLNDLDIRGNFTDEGLPHLETLKGLKSLRIRSQNDKEFSTDAIELLRSKLPNVLVLEAERIKERKRRPRVGKTAPPFNQTTLDGEEIELEDYRGKVVLLHFWSLSSRVTREVKPFYEELKKKHQDFEMIGLYRNNQEERVRKYVEKHGLSWPQVPAVFNSQLAADYGVSGSRAYFLVDPDGKVVLNWSYDLDKIRETIEELM
ncbi:redoxin domain-containing protein, partial [Candidatus Hydrogenedentota bacterium]